MKKEDFNETYKTATEVELLKETLYTQKQLLRVLENNRKNTSNIVWLIIIPIFILMIFGFISYLSGLTVLG